MLSFLQIRDFAIVEALDLDFSTGFTCITGETGAGKSILVGALGLLTGQRADSSTVRSGADKAELTAEFEIEPDSEAARWLGESDLLQGGSCLLRRMISEKGRSRAWINGTAVTLQQLAEFGSHLVEIHGQNEHLKLLQTREQFRLLDAGATTTLRERVATRFGHWLELQQEKDRLLAESPLDAGDAELLDFHIAELQQGLDDSARYAQLDKEHRALARAGEIQQALKYCLSVFEAESGGGALAVLQRVKTELEPFAELDGELSGAIGLVDEALINCVEAQASIDRAGARFDPDPGRLQDLDSRIGRLHDLARKHRSEPDQLAEVMDRLSERLARSADREQRLQQLEPEIENALQGYREAARSLHEQRRVAATSLGEKVTGMMQDLGMPGGHFLIDVIYQEDAPPSANGADKLDFRVSANPGTEPAPLRKVASGGELSRISLAMKVAAQASLQHTVQVFDEVDAGIGGETASSVGALIKGLSGQAQALCVTHLAQVAVFADHQIQVAKASEADRTRVDSRKLGEDQRIDEIARMLGGTLSDQSRAHASELLAAASVRH